jgi:hypothetical protein
VKAAQAPLVVELSVDELALLEGWAGAAPRPAYAPDLRSRRPIHADTTGATVSPEIPREVQYLEASHTVSSLVPLLELHDAQQRAMFSRVTMRASLTMCSQVARAPRCVGSGENATRQ